MGISNKLKFFALVVVVGALAITPIALAAGLTVKTTPAHPKKGQMVQMKVSGLKAGEKVKAVLTLTASGQKATRFHQHRPRDGEGQERLDLHGTDEPQERQHVLHGQVAEEISMKAR
jgi:hypothetical protein